MDRTIYVLLSLIVPVGIPVLVIYWVANGRSKSKSHLVVKTLAAGLVMAALYIGNVWFIASHYLRYVFLILFVCAAAYGWLRLRELAWWERPTRVREWVSLGAGVVVIGASGWLVAQVAGADRAPDGAVEIDFPFQEGTFVPAHAGSKQMMNHHVGSLHEPLYRGQTWALDIMQIDRVGRRARGFYPRDLARYRTFGTPVVAPCGGMIFETANDYPDHPPPDREPDIEDAPGNFVKIQCDEGFFVILAHLAQGSVRLDLGDRVSSGDVLGAIGNSGNTTEPHLHINAQVGAGEDYFLDSDPLPIIFRGHGFLKRNDVVRVSR